MIVIVLTMHPEHDVPSQSSIDEGIEEPEGSMAAGAAEPRHADSGSSLFEMRLLSSNTIANGWFKSIASGDFDAAGELKRRYRH
jgi:hypothetical protein